MLRFYSELVPCNCSVDVASYTRTIKRSKNVTAIQCFISGSMVSSKFVKSISKKGAAVYT